MIRAARAGMIAIVLGVLAGVMEAQAPASLPAYRNRLLGVFNEAGDPIEGAEVIDVLSRTSALTTKTGTVSLVFLPDTGTMVRVQKIGYRPATLIVAISPADTLPVTVVLNAIATSLPAVVTKGDSAPRHISPGLQAFEERRKMGFGRFLTEADLRKSDNRSMTNVIRGVGVKVECSTRTPIRCFATSTRGCGELEVYMDGIIVNRDDRDLEKMRTDQYGGVEVYFGAATIPPQYNKTGSACGVLLFWSRER